MKTANTNPITTTYNAGVPPAPPKASRKAVCKSDTKAEIQQIALTNAVEGQSFANYQAIFEGFAAMGIPLENIEPRANVFTFNAWKALGRFVRKGEHGVKIITMIPCTKKDKETGEEIPVKKFKNTTVFHVSQTDAIDGEPEGETVSSPASDSAPAPIMPPEEHAIKDTPAEVVADAQEAREPNAYELRIQAKRERYEAKAMAAEGESTRVYRRARQMGEAIPFGQPILVGHHSERRDRNYRNRIHNTYGKAFALQDKAEHYAQKAATVGTGGISSDDPDAIKKLRAELADCEQLQERMKAGNKAIRSNKTPEAQIAALVAVGFSETNAGKLIEKDFAGRIGFASYQLSNNNANMSRIKGRIATLEQLRTRTDVEKEGEGFTYREDTEENRVMFCFDGKPDAATRTLLKSHAFKWSPSRNAWVRQLNNAAIWNGQEIFKQLSALKSAE